MENIPLYRTRRFWAVIYSLMLAWSVFFYFWAFYNPNAINLLRIISEVLMSLGASFFGLWGRFFLDSLGAYLGVVTYAGLQAYFFIKTFRAPRVKLLFPIFFTVNFILGIIMNILYLGSFA